MKYKAEFHLYGDSGYQIAIADTPDKLMQTLKQRGFSLTLREKTALQQWASGAKDGARYHLEPGRAVITKGDDPMTAYTSL